VVCDAASLSDEAAGVRPTAVIDAIVGAFVAPALALLGPYGRYVVLGTSAGADVQLNWQAVYRSHLRALGYSGMILSSDDRRRSLQPVLLALADGRIRISVTRILPPAGGRDPRLRV